MKSHVSALVAGLLSFSTAHAAVMGGPSNVCPPEAIAAGFKTPVFYRSYTDLSQFDVSNSKKPGYQWYVSAPPFEGNVLTPTSPSDYSISGGVLTINQNVNTGLGGNQFITCAYNGVSAPRTTCYPLFQPGGYYEWTISFDVNGVNSNGWPGAGLLDYNLLLAQIDNNPSESTSAAEIDFYECIAASPCQNTTNVIQWSGLTRANQNPNLHPNFNAFGTINWNNPNTIGLVWITMAQGGGTGDFKRYINHNYMSDGDLTYTNASPFAIADSPVSGYTMNMQSGATGAPFPLKVYSLLVCQ